MIHSMTGYGQASRSIEHHAFHVEIRTVNHRYQETVIRMPREWYKLEDALKRLVQRYVTRGRVDVSITMERENSAEVDVIINWPLAEGYYQAAQQLKEQFSFDSAVELRDLLLLPDVVQFQEKQDHSEQWMKEQLLACTEEALQHLTQMRRAEGEQLRADMMQRFNILEKHCEEIVTIVPQMQEEYRQMLQGRVAEIVSDMALDEQRLLMEVALLAERTNIDEELTRLASHFEMSKELLNSRGPAGRKLDFLIQEMNREINTIGSKTNITRVVNLVIEMKAELEKVREQVQNIE